MTKNIFVFDQNKCVGCGACSVACMNENSQESAIPWRNIFTSNPQAQPDIPLFYLTMSCNHCDDAPCMKGCPALAYTRDHITGAVLHHADKCIGCQYCTWTCPFDAPKYNSQKGIVEKCTFCNHRIHEGLKPACAELCPVGALDFEATEFSRQESRDSSPLPVDIGAKIRIIPKEAGNEPEMDLSLFGAVTPQISTPVSGARISAKKEWPLVIFTLVATGMVGFLIARRPGGFSTVEKMTFVILCVLAAGLSTMHLGRKERAWRAILNVRNSWLSREIAFFSLFAGMLILDFYMLDIPDVLIELAGVGLLVSIDMLYRPATWNWPMKTHSGQVVAIGLSLVLLLKSAVLVFGVIAVLRIFLYFYRKLKYNRLWSVFTAVRIISLVLGVVLLQMENGLYAILVFALGEVIDRIEFYNELKVSSPQDHFEQR